MKFKNMEEKKLVCLLYLLYYFDINPQEIIDYNGQKLKNIYYDEINNCFGKYKKFIYNYYDADLNDCSTNLITNFYKLFSFNFTIENVLNETVFNRLLNADLIETHRWEGQDNKLKISSHGREFIEDLIYNGFLNEKELYSKNYINFLQSFLARILNNNEIKIEKQINNISGNQINHENYNQQH